MDPEDRKWLDQKIIEYDFSRYEELAELLLERDYVISKSAVGRYGKKFKDRLARLRVASAQAQAIVRDVGDDQGAMGEALSTLAQERCFQVLMNLDPEDQDVRIDQLLKGISKLGNTSIKQKEWRLEVRGRAKEAAEEVDDIVQQAGLSDEAAGDIRSKILGVAA